MSSGKVVILMGSKRDLRFSDSIFNLLKKFGIECDRRIASAHKTPEHVLEVLKDYEGLEAVVYITVAGGSNTLSGLVDANTKFPVIACPPYSKKFGGADVFSSLRMPSGVSPPLILEPESTALAAAKIIALKDPNLQERISSYQAEMKEDIRKSNRKIVN